MSRSTSRRLVRKSALATVVLLAAASGLTGCSSGGAGGCPQSVYDKITEQEAEGGSARVIPVSEFPVEELQSSLSGACVVATSSAPGSAGGFYWAVAPQGVSAETLADAAMEGGFEWTDMGGGKPFGEYVRSTDPTIAPGSEYLFLQEVDAEFIETLGGDFVEGQTAVFYQVAEVIVD